jgi:hypothetical protein
MPKKNTQKEHIKQTYKNIPKTNFFLDKQMSAGYVSFESLNHESTR